MTELIYYQDQYKTELEAKIVKTEGNKILLDKTIFIPQTNNEPGDFGKIQAIKIAGSQKKEKKFGIFFPGIIILLRSVIK